jgi:hypothetical protein
MREREREREFNKGFQAKKIPENHSPSPLPPQKNWSQQYYGWRDVLKMPRTSFKPVYLDYSIESVKFCYLCRNFETEAAAGRCPTVDKKMDQYQTIYIVYSAEIVKASCYYRSIELEAVAGVSHGLQKKKKSDQFQTDICRS